MADPLNREAIPQDGPVLSFWAWIQHLSSLLSEELTCVRAGVCSGHPSVCVSSLVVGHVCHLLLGQGERGELWATHVLWIQPLWMPACCLHPSSLLQLIYTCLWPPLPHDFTALFFSKAKQINSCPRSWAALHGSPALHQCVPCSPVCCQCPARLLALHQLTASPCTAWPAPRPQVALELLTPAMGAARCFGV